MKYIIDSIFVLPGETQSQIREKIAKRIRLPENKIRYEIISRDWVSTETKKGMLLKAAVETKEFVRDTSIGIDPIEQEESWPLLVLPYRPVVVGFGVIGMFAAYGLAKAGLRPIVLERGEPLNNRDSFDEHLPGKLHFGEGGRAAYSGALFTSSKASTDLRVLCKEEGINLPFLDEHSLLSPQEVRLILATLHRRILDLGGEVKFGAKFLGTSTFFGSLRKVTYEQNGKKETIKTKRILFADGSHNDDYRLGLVIESSTKDFDKCIYDRNIKDPKAPLYFHMEQSKDRSVCLMVGFRNSRVLPASRDKNQNELMFELAGKGKNHLSLLFLSLGRNDIQSMFETSFSAAKPFTLPVELVRDFMQRTTPLHLGTLKFSSPSGARLERFDNYFEDENSANLRRKLATFGKKYPFLISENSLITGFFAISGKPLDYKEKGGNCGVYVASVPVFDSLDFAAAASAGLSSARRLIDEGTNAR